MCYCLKWIGSLCLYYTSISNIFEEIKEIEMYNLGIFMNYFLNDTNFKMVIVIITCFGAILVAIYGY